jgi:hypothetical protein
MRNWRNSVILEEKMNKVYISHTPNGDTRSMEKLDKTLVYQDTLGHIKGVKDVMNELANKLRYNAQRHDFTKLSHFDGFYEALASRKVAPEFYELEWWKLHETAERHHLNQKVPDDVNLLDVIEMLVDCVCAGKARTGNVYPINISSETLQKAVANTVEMLKNNIIVIKD